MAYEQQLIAEAVLHAYQRRNKPWGPVTHWAIGVDMPGDQLQAYQNWRTAWLTTCLSYMTEPNFASSSVLDAQVDIYKSQGLLTGRLPPR